MALFGIGFPGRWCPVSQEHGLFEVSGDEFRQRRAGVQGLLGVRSGAEHQRAAHADPLLQGLDAGVLRRKVFERTSGLLVEITTMSTPS